MAITEKKIAKDAANSSQKGLSEGLTRFTAIIATSTIEDIKNVAYWDRENMKDVIGTAFEDFLSKWKKQNPKLVIDGRVKGK
jgi:hypothetical protein